MKTKVKICGITNVDDALLAESLGADFIGLIFAEQSPRCVAIDIAKKITNKLTIAKPIGVFVEQNKQEAQEIANKCNLWGIQHYTYFEDGFDKRKYIYAVRMNKTNMQKDLSSIICDYLLLDSYDEKLHGGTGKVFDWSKIPLDRGRIFLAGGLNPENIAKAAQEKIFSLDLSSGVELNARKKDTEKLQLLFKNLKG